jgi:hypothetical protein
MEYARAGSREGGRVGAAESAELEDVLARLVEGWVELDMARAMAERVELLLEPGERWMR